MTEKWDGLVAKCKELALAMWRMSGFPEEARGLCSAAELKEASMTRCQNCRLSIELQT